MLKLALMSYGRTVGVPVPIEKLRLTLDGLRKKSCLFALLLIDCCYTLVSIGWLCFRLIGGGGLNSVYATSTFMSSSFLGVTCIALGFRLISTSSSFICDGAIGK